MPNYTVTQVLNAARAHLADDRVAGGAIYRNDTLMEHFQSAYRQVFRLMSQLTVDLTQAEFFYNLPAYTGYLDPVSIGVNDVGEIREVKERAIDGSLSVSGVSVSSGVITLTTAAHGRSTGNRVIVYGLGGLRQADGLWTVTAPSSTTLQLNGSYAAGTYTSGGTVSWASEEFTDVDPVDELDESTGTPGTALSTYAWSGDAFRFKPCSAARQLRVKYYMSGTAPSSVSDTVRIQDGLDLLSRLTAGYAARFRNPNISKQLLAEALGPAYEATQEIGGVAHEMLQSAVRELQRVQTRRPAYRAPLHLQAF